MTTAGRNMCCLLFCRKWSSSNTFYVPYVRNFAWNLLCNLAKLNSKLKIAVIKITLSHPTNALSPENTKRDTKRYFTCHDGTVFSYKL